MVRDRNPAGADPGARPRVEALEALIEASRHAVRDHPRFRSRGEARLAGLFDRLGVGYEYERPTPVFDRGRWRLWRPDYMLAGYGDLLVEYAGMPDRPAYMQGVVHKARAYRANGRRAVFLYPGDLYRPGWSDHVMRRIEAAAGPPINRHPATSAAPRYGAARR